MALWMGIFRRNPQKVPSIFAGIVRHAANDALLIKQIVIERWNRAHMDSAEHEHAALLQSFYSGRHQFASRREDDSGIKLRGGASVASPAQTAPSWRASC